MIRKYYHNIILFFLALSAYLFPFNWILGSHAAFFSFSSIMLPALGYHTSLLYVTFAFLTKGAFVFSYSFYFFLRRLPLLFATAALQKRSFLLYVVLPVSMMVLFIADPVGRSVFYYSFFWFVPIGLYSFFKDSLLLRSFAASFIAHAIGSVVWLYTTSIPAEIWTALMPIVPIERAFIALGMCSFVYGFAQLRTILMKKVLV